jgi:hypothetical protein
MGRRIVTATVHGATSVSVDVYSAVTAAAETPTAEVAAGAYAVPADAKAAPNAPAPPAEAPAPDDYISKLIKYIPTEVVTLYLFVDGILKSFNSSPAVNWIVFFLLLALTPVYIWRMTTEKTKACAWDQIAVSFVSFALWVYVIGGPFVTLSWYVPQYGYILVAIFTVFTPLLKK